MNNEQFHSQSGGMESQNNMLLNQINLSISLLGSFRCQVDGKDISSDFRTKKERALIAFLSVEANRQHRRDVLGEMFWPSKPEGYARMNLRQAFWGIRRAMKLPTDQFSIFEISDSFVRLNPESDIDVLVTFAPEARYGLFDLVDMEDELKKLFERDVDMVEKEAIIQSENYIRRKNILENTKVIYAAG